MKRLVTVQTAVGEPQPGEWCERCLLPSAFRFTLYGLALEGVFVLGTVTRCPDCYHPAKEAR